MALATDDRVKAGQWTVSSAESSWTLACAEYMPSLSLGADYYALGDQPEVQFTLALPIVVQQPILIATCRVSMRGHAAALYVRADIFRR